MNKLSESFQKLKDKFQSMRRGAKIALIISTLAVIIAVISFIIYSTSDKYGLLFSNLDPKDAQVVTEQLKEKKITSKVKGNSIYVPKDKVDELRLELATELTNGSKGYEIMDESKSFGMTDEEFKIKKLRMLQGEIERTIKSFPQIENARVHITPSKDSVFVKDNTPGRAAVYIQLKQNEDLNQEQVKSIIALVSGSTENIPKENVEIIDHRMNLLSRGIFDSEGKEIASSTSVEKQQEIEKDFERKLENNVMEMLESVLGKGKVKVKVNADLDFDSKQKTQIVVDPNKVEISEHSIKEINNNAGNRTSQSPVDNQMGNTIGNNTTGTNNSSKEEHKVNYEVGKTETRTLSAPGEVKRLTASVIVDGNLDPQSQGDLKNTVSNALGFKADRGDEITVVGMNFDPSQKALIAKELEEMQNQAEKAKKMALYKSVALIVLGIIALITIAVILIKVFRRNREDDYIEGGALDVVIGDEIAPKNPEDFKPITFEEENEKTHLEKEIKGYAKEKPEQVADIIRAWLTEDER